MFPKMLSHASRHIVASTLALALGCGGESAPVPTPQSAVTPVDPATAGDVRVSVLYKGAPPQAKEISMRSNPQCAAQHQGPVLEESLVVKDGRLQNAVVYIQEGLGTRVFATPSEAVQVDQKGCQYTPHVVAAMVAQPVAYMNSDPEAHNVHGEPKVVRSWNFMMSRQGSSRPVTFDKAEVGIPVRCDIHPWMSGYISVFNHPYFGVTGADGIVSLKQVPAGEYKIAVWQEKLGTKTASVKVEPKGSTSLEFAFE